MKKNWAWLVLLAAVAVAVAFIVAGRFSDSPDTGPHIGESEMASAEEFDTMPPTDAGGSLDAMDVTFKGVTNDAVGKAVGAQKKE